MSQVLAAASEDAVLAAWSGLGYYRRARMLHQCARRIAAQHGGCFPRKSEASLALPGIGRYTAAAIASIAFAEPVAVVDGNVERVLRTIDRHQSDPAANLATCTGASRPVPARRFQSGHDGTGRNRVRAARAPLLRLPGPEMVRHAGTKCRTQGARLPDQKKKQIWCVLDWRNGKGSRNDDGRHGQIRLVQRPKKASLMPGMWELPQSSEPPRPLPVAAHWRTFRHSITVTDYTVHVLRNVPLSDA